MNLYPALQFDMGAWRYFVVKMSARELSEQVKFASEIDDDRTLDEAIQRVLNTSRVKKEIVTYVQKQPYRFFSSIVVAALGGKPQFYPVQIADDPQFQLFADDDRLNESFGVLRFDGTQDYYALDGQHRLAAIRSALDRDDPLSDNTPESFRDDEFSVLIVVPNMDDDEQTFRQKYRRLFSNLNRYAKPMDQATNIIMDEDDAFAIVTRGLISEHEFFRWEGRHKDSPRIKAKKGKNLKSNDPYFTSIETLYEINSTLLASKHRENSGWPHPDEIVDIKQFVRFRPDDHVIDELQRELFLYWDAILGELPELRNDPTMMRDHSAAERDAGEGDGFHASEDHLLFWPIGQQLFADFARYLLDVRQSSPDQPRAASVEAALVGVGDLEWRLSEAPWRNLLLVPVTKESDGSVHWRMRSEDRKPAVAVGKRILMWQIGEDELSEEELVDLRDDFLALVVGLSDEAAKKRWDAIVQQAL